ncbi:hypothetical protein M6I34_17610 [Burkholderiaceae bacterium FT117]|uniref:cytochrome c peroxidase n=1 Tax=Zeimonas sediminis TaxID=2944268 RepID=UPI002342F1C2|nr:cytochrome c peroxidase [Zeimonas sediminis]MCM5572334.1 hypothetical protein [Zeimonas sediminis]
MNPLSDMRLRILAVALGCLVLASCGSGGDSAATDPANIAEAAPPPPPRAPVEPLQLVTAPDINVLGLLDKTGLNANLWPWEPITKTDQKTALQQFGKALFWDMQVGGDGIQSCASCHYHAGADNRVANQVSPGLKRGDFAADIAALNASLNRVHYSGTAQVTVNGVATTVLDAGFPVSEAALLASGATADAADGAPGALGFGAKPLPNVDVNDVASSQGVRAGDHHSVTVNRVDTATLRPSDPGFDLDFQANAAGVPDTVRRVEPRNSPTVLNAVYNLRNFWDGRGDAFFNGVTPLGFRDPDARVKTFTNGALGEERLDLPFSSLASQAVGPIESEFEMTNAGRIHKELGKKLTTVGVLPLAGQLIATDDSLLGDDPLLGGLGKGPGNRGLTKPYAQWIREIFHERFWGDGAGNDVCLDANGAMIGVSPADTCYTNPALLDPADGSPLTAYTMMQWNFSLFFGLGIQAYEATLFTNETIVDLVAGGIAQGSITVGTGRRARTVVVGGPTIPQAQWLSLEGCIAQVGANLSAREQALATDLCTTHYAKFINPNAVTGSESNLAPFPVPANEPIGGKCGPNSGASTTTTVVVAGDCVFARNTLLNVDRGLGRFFAGATACAICHFNPEFTGATVGVMTGFGIAPELLNPGQARRAELRAVMERMVAFNGLPKVYDTGFYNIGVRPTPEDLSLGDAIGGVPLGWNRLFDLMAGGPAFNGDAQNLTYDMDKIGTFANPAQGTIAGLIPSLMIPFSPTDLSPIPFPFRVGCGVGLVGNGNANNNPNVNCTATVIPGEPLLRNGAFKAPGLRNVKFTGPYMHNGSKATLRQVMEFYKTAGHFAGLNFNNLDAGMRVFNLGVADEAAVVEMMETGLTDWRVAHQSGPFDHPEICVPNGHDESTGVTRLVAIPAVGTNGGPRLATFEEMLEGTAAGLANNLTDACTVPGIVDAGGLSTIDVPPAPPPI